MTIEYRLESNILEIRKFTNLTIEINNKFNTDKYSEFRKDIKEMAIGTCLTIIGEATIRIMNENPLFIKEFGNYSPLYAACSYSSNMSTAFPSSAI